MCRVQYAMCPDGVNCSVATSVTGRITLNLLGIFIDSSCGLCVTWETLYLTFFVFFSLYKHSSYSGH